MLHKHTPLRWRSVMVVFKSSSFVPALWEGGVGALCASTFKFPRRSALVGFKSPRYTIRKRLLLPIQHLLREQPRARKRLTQPPFLQTSLPRVSLLPWNHPIRLDELRVQQGNTALQTPSRNTAVRAFHIIMVNVLHGLTGACVNRRATRRIPVEQIRRAHLIWSLAHQHHLAVRFRPNVLRHEILSHTRADCCGVP